MKLKLLKAPATRVDWVLGPSLMTAQYGGQCERGFTVLAVCFLRRFRFTIFGVFCQWIYKRAVLFPIFCSRDDFCVLFSCCYIRRNNFILVLVDITVRQGSLLWAQRLYRACFNDIARVFRVGGSLSCRLPQCMVAGRQKNAALN